MRKVFFFLLYLSFLLQARAQIYLNKKYDLGYSEAALNIVPVASGEYYSIFQRFDGVTRAIVMVKLNSVGDTIWSKSIFKTGFQYYSSPNSLVLSHDSCFLFAGTITDTTGKDVGYLAKFNMNGDSLWMRIFSGAGYIHLRDCYETKEKEIISSGDIKSISGSYADYYFIKTDSNGFKIWEKSFSNSSLNDVSINCIQTLEGGYLLSGYAELNSIRVENWLVKTDSSGTMLWNKKYYAVYSDAACTITQLSDSTLITTGKRGFSSSSSAYGRIRKLKPNGDTLWTKEIINTNYLSLNYPALVLPDKSFYVLGSTLQPNNTTFFRAFIGKFDSLGNEQWRKMYTTNNAQPHGFYDYRLTADNGLVLSGLAGGPTQDAWILTLDSLGCEVAGCNAIGITEVKSPFSFSLYPNPAGDYITLQLSSPDRDLIIELFDVNGKSVLTLIPGLIDDEITIPLHRLSNGIYSVKISDSQHVLFGTKKIIIQR